jgi:uncharacterized membrane-anchored protein
MSPSPATDVRRPALLSKVPEVSALFWGAKLLTTGMGEACSDYFGEKYSPVLVGPIAGLVLVAALWLQFRSTRYVPAVYWFAVAMVAVVGTMAADVTHVIVGIPYGVTTPVFVVVLGVVFWRWWASERTLSIHTVTTARRERFYWAAVMATFALGTAAGDLTAFSLKLGFLASGFLFLAVMAVPAIAFWRFGLNPVAGFWLAYIVTRPLGASFADWMGKPADRTGLGWGDGPVTLVATLAIAVLVVAMTLTHRRSVDEAEPAA